MNAVAFLIPVLDKWLWYAPLHGAAALLNGSAARSMQAGAKKRLPRELDELYQMVQTPTDALPRPLDGELIPSTLGIIPTRGCNMQCVYCNFAGSSARDAAMSPEIATAAVDWAVKARAEAGEQLLHVQFFGGEPFVAQDVVELVVERAREGAARRGMTTYFDASTNGLFSDSMCRYIGDHFDAIVLSLDGPPEYQDRYRPLAKGRASSRIVQRNAHSLSDMSLELCLRLCVTQESVRDMTGIVRWMVETFKPATINFESLTASDLAMRSGLAPPDPFEFAVRADEAFTIAEAAGVKAVYAATESAAPRLSLCPVGKDAVIVSPDGRLSACYLMPEEWQSQGLDLDIGVVDPKRGVTFDFEKLAKVRRLPAEKSRCAQCFCQYNCAGGCHVNLARQHGDYPDYCIQTRLIMTSRLLHTLGFDELCSRLLRDRTSMERLARCPSDVVNTDVAAG